MSFAEFKAWLDGFKEAVGDAPTPEQWVKVLTKLETVSMDWTRGIGGGPLIPHQSGSLHVPHDPSIRVNN